MVVSMCSICRLLHYLYLLPHMQFVPVLGETLDLTILNLEDSSRAP
jgi:hypothetical protein